VRGQPPQPSNQGVESVDLVRNASVGDIPTNVGPPTGTEPGLSG